MEDILNDVADMLEERLTLADIIEGVVYFCACIVCVTSVMFTIVVYTRFFISKI